MKWFKRKLPNPQLEYIQKGQYHLAQVIYYVAARYSGDVLDILHAKYRELTDAAEGAKRNPDPWWTAPVYKSPGRKLLEKDFVFGRHFMRPKFPLVSMVEEFRKDMGYQWPAPPPLYPCPCCGSTSKTTENAYLACNRCGLPVDDWAAFAKDNPHGPGFYVGNRKCGKRLKQAAALRTVGFLTVEEARKRFYTDLLSLKFDETAGETLGRFGHHPDHTIDAEVEIDRLEGLIAEARAVHKGTVRLEKEVQAVKENNSTVRWVEWIEPFGPNNQPVYMAVPADTAIADAKYVASLHQHTYKNDEDALSDFMVVHWADFCSPRIAIKSGLPGLQRGGSIAPGQPFVVGE